MENEKSNQTKKKTAGSCPSAMNSYLFICFFFVFSVVMSLFVLMPFYIFLFLQQAQKTLVNYQPFIIIFSWPQNHALISKENKTYFELCRCKDKRIDLLKLTLHTLKFRFFTPANLRSSTFTLGKSFTFE